MMNTPLLRRVAHTDIARQHRPVVDADTLAAAADIVSSVRQGGERTIRTFAERFGERAPHRPLVLGPSDMHTALDAIDADDRAALQRAAARIEAFARAQRSAIGDVTIPVPGGRAGHSIEPLHAAGCYAPAGRYPLPSSVLMTAVTARVAGCERVVVASPGAHPLMLAAAAIAGADEFLAVGGAHAVAALAFGFKGFARCDVIAGPGNKWVSAAKKIVAGDVGIDMLAGPSELMIIAEAAADPRLIAADLLAQAEHDADAVPMLVVIDAPPAEQLIRLVQAELNRQLATLPTREVARAALGNGFLCLAATEAQAADIANHCAPEHLELLTADPAATAALIHNAGALFLGHGSAEVLADYGAGPNHTLPTGGTARFQGGLSVFHFLRLRTWLAIDNPAPELIADTEHLARLEGLAAHRASAAARRQNA